MLLFFRSPSPVQAERKNEINKFSRTLRPQFRTLDIEANSVIFANNCRHAELIFNMIRNQSLQEEEENGAAAPICESESDSDGCGDDHDGARLAVASRNKKRSLDNSEYLMSSHNLT